MLDPRRLLGRRLAAVAACFSVVGLHAAPALALPKPRTEEWWFGAWEITNKVWPLSRGDGVTVAVIDTGVQADLPDLKGVVLRGVEFDTRKRGDGRQDLDTEKGGHGTAMAALIAGQGLGAGMVGLAPKSKILPVSAAIDNQVKTIHYAVDHGAKVINISSGVALAHCPDEVQQALEYAIEHDVVIVAAAGNDGDAAESGYTPANCAGVLAVGAVSANLEPWKESTPGDNVMVAAPGVMVGSIGRAGIFEGDHSGTSQATALTSAVVALVRAKYPKMSGRQVVQRIVATTKDIPPAGWDKKTGYGAIIPYLALTANVPNDATNPVYDKHDLRAQRGANRITAPRKTHEHNLHSSRKGSRGRTLTSVPILASGGAIAGAAISFVLFVRVARRSERFSKS